MKKSRLKCPVLFFAFLIVFITVITAPAASAATAKTSSALNNAIILYCGSPNAYVKGALVKIDPKNSKAAPCISNKQMAVPLLFICDCVYGKYGVDMKTSTVTTFMAQKKIVFKLKSNIVLVNNRKVTLEAPVYSSNGCIFAPLKGLASLIGKKLFTQSGLIVLSDTEKILDSTRDAALIRSLAAEVNAGKDKKLALVFSPQSTVAVPALEKYSLPGVFTMQKPKGWSVYKGGEYQTIAYYERDNNEPLRQVYCFSQIGPVYTSQQQKATEYNYVNYMNGYPIAWLDMPVISPFTPEKYVLNLDNIFNSSIAKGFFSQYNMPRMTEMQDLQIISKKQFAGSYPGTTSGLIRALFKKGNKAAECLFFVTVLPDAYGHGTGYTVSAITAPINEFAYYEPVLLKSFSSFKLEDSYVKAGMQAIEENGEDLKEVSKTISETGDIIMENWNSRQKPDDALSQKKSDEILGYERFYDANSGEVYRVPLDSADAASASGLKRLGDSDYDLWLQTPIDR